MLIFLILNIVIFSCSQAENVFDTFLKDSVDWKVNPCDDFYHHVCSKDVEHSLADYYVEPVWEMIENAEYKSKTKESRVLQEFLESPIETILKNVEEAENEMVYLCTKKSSQFEKYLLKIAKLLKPISKHVAKCVKAIDIKERCEEKTKGLSICWNKLFENEYPEAQKNVTATLLDRVKIHNWIVKEGSPALQRINATLEEVKQNAIQLIKKTPWIKNARKVRVFEKLANSVTFPDEFREVFVRKEKLFQKAAKRFSKCVQKAKINKSLAEIFCIVELYNVIEKYMDEKEIVMEQDQAENDDGVLHFGEYFYHASIELDETQYMAFVGATIGHEFGHTIILDDYDLSNDGNLIFSKNRRQCVQQQFENSCQFFEESNCTVLSTQFDDNGADLIGFKIAFEIFKNQLKTSTIEENKKFFYSFAAGWCDVYPTEGDEEHQPPNIRVNAFVSQIQEFQEIFECEK